MSATLVVAYFTMEIALDAAMPTYAGGLGVLAGDMLRAAVMTESALFLTDDGECRHLRCARVPR